MPDQFLFSLTIAGIYLLAGSVKGVFGIGVPTTSITLMTLFIAPLEAIAINPVSYTHLTLPTTTIV